MKIASILNNSTAEVYDYFADIVYFQGCARNCCYCFNPELRTFEGGEEIKYYEIENRLSDISHVTVLTGGDPLCQKPVHPEIEPVIPRLIAYLRSMCNKKVVLETSFYHKESWELADKVLVCLKTFDIDEDVIKGVNEHSNVIPLVVIGHECFDMDGFKYLVNKIDKTIRIRSTSNTVKDLATIYKILNGKYGEFRGFKKVCL